jgi:predicted nucleotidyltransferase component of viral defense system
MVPAMATLREQFIERLIREIFLKQGSGYVLKGGGAMLALFGEQRLTKDVDLDFTEPKRSADSLQKTMRRAIDVAARGLPVTNLRVAVPGKSELTPRWKVNFEDRQGTPFHVEIEVSRDARRAAPGAVVQLRYVPPASGGMAPFWVDIYDRPTLVTSKLAALLGRGAARDVYDLDLLLPEATPTTAQVRWAIERANLRGQDPLEVLADRMDALSWERYLTDLRDALPEHLAERIDKAEWTAMKARVRTNAESLLANAVAGAP